MSDEMKLGPIIDELANHEKRLAALESRKAEPDAEKATRKGVYVASRANVQERVAMWQKLRASGVHITSSWIDEAAPRASASLPDLWRRVEQEICKSERFILYAETGDFPLKGALVEVGIAIGAGVPVFVVLPGVELEPRSLRPIGSWIRHPLVRLVNTIQDGVQWRDEHPKPWTTAMPTNEAIRGAVERVRLHEQRADAGLGLDDSEQLLDDVWDLARAYIAEHPKLEPDAAQVAASREEFRRGKFQDAEEVLADIRLDKLKRMSELAPCSFATLTQDGIDTIRWAVVEIERLRAEQAKSAEISCAVDEEKAAQEYADTRYKPDSGHHTQGMSDYLAGYRACEEKMKVEIKSIKKFYGETVNRCNVEIARLRCTAGVSRELMFGEVAKIRGHIVSGTDEDFKKSALQFMDLLEMKLAALPEIKPSSGISRDAMMKVLDDTAESIKSKGPQFRANTRQETDADAAWDRGFYKAIEAMRIRITILSGDSK